jgi:hypothetical protein
MDNKLWDTIAWRVLQMVTGDVLVIRSDFVAEEDVTDLRQAILKHTGKKIGIIVLPSESEFTTLDLEDRRALVQILSKSLEPEDPLIPLDAK